MYTTTNVHGVKSVRLSKVRKPWNTSDFYVRDVTIEDKDGNTYMVTLFADESENLAVAANGKSGDSLSVGEDTITQTA